MENERIQAVKADITTLEVDAVVNAANRSLLGGGGVDGAIHRAAGPGLLAECRKLNGCETGDAKVTGGYDLPARHVIHTVGPVWSDGSRGEPDLLASCYRRSLEEARDLGLRTVAFPAISTGVYRFPAAKAAAVAVEAIRDFLSNNTLPEKVLLVAFDDRMLEILVKELEPREEGSLSRFMEYVSKEYAKYFNKKYDRIGHVFQGRFKIFLIQRERYYFACSRYIALNPVKANVVSDPKSYIWSGYPSLACGKEGPIKLDRNDLYLHLGANPTERRIAYRALVLNQQGIELDLMNRRAGVLGDSEFRRKIKNK